MTAMKTVRLAAAQPSLLDKVQLVERSIADGLIERDDEARALVRCVLANEHLLLVGEPGTAKSLLCESLAKCIKDMNDDNYFAVLLGKDSNREEVFGPIRVSKLPQDCYSRKVDRYLPSAHIAFLDEIWKASTAILNTLLTILNERRFDNDGVRVNCPLRTALAASNEWPDGAELGAMFDRFLVRRTVKPVSRARLNDLLFGALPAPSPVVTLGELDQAAGEAMSLTFSPEAMTCFGEIVDELESNGIRPGDRRKRKSLSIAKAEAWLSGANVVEPIHLEPIADCLWVEPIEQPNKTIEIVTRMANPQQSAVNSLLVEIESVVRRFKADPHNVATRRACGEKALEIERTAKAIGTPKAIRLASHARKQWQTITASALLG